VNTSGHFWTLFVRTRDAFLPPHGPDGCPWSTVLIDPVIGPVRLTGLLDEPPGAEILLVLLHGLGGSATSPYLARAAAAARALGLATLRLSLRGADGSGEDLYHAGITEDLAAALRSPEAARYRGLLLLGYSLGGHLVLRYGTLDPDPRVLAAAAVCAPLDLLAGVAVLDGPGTGLYRRYLLRPLKREYARVVRRRSLPVPGGRVALVRTIREYDDLTVAPRHGFASAEDYYARVSVGPRLDRLAVPSLLVFSERDPMVPPSTVRPTLARPGGHREVVWTDRGGHVGFPRDLDLGLGGGLGLEAQVLHWLTDRVAERWTRGSH